VSKRSEEYVNELTRCPDGFRINCAHKAILGVLSECHSPVRKTIWPSIKYIAEHACVSLSTAKAKMKQLEQHLVIERVRPESQGRGQFTEYVFLEIDAPERLRQKMLTLGLGDGFDEEEKGVSITPLSEGPEEGERGQEGVNLDPQKGSGRGQEGVKTAIRNKEEPGTGNRFEPGMDSINSLGTISDLPEGLDASSYASAVMDQLGMVRDRRYFGAEHSVMVSAIEILAREEQLSPRAAALAIYERGHADALNGAVINRFWLQDKKFKQPQKSGVTSINSIPRDRAHPPRSWQTRMGTDERDSCWIQSRSLDAVLGRG
jgi:hypothetical protein